MIEYNLMQYLQSHDELGFDFSVNFSTLKDDAVTVYSSAGNQPSLYKGVLIAPRYQVIVKSSDYDKATEMAYNVSELFEQLKNTVMNIELKTKSIPVRVFDIYPLHIPALLGVNDDDVMEYSINFETQLKVIHHAETRDNS
ncbi:phage tail terminator protein [Staphylococcus pettenkoferi]|uniref:phage tail terminator protein n=1 Tax=Staphylococcus pettenkoferi TaxID=170573 RepID=UPI002272E8B4|nr:minor capsid protein [Staphylococcus pettenkoferi]MCY1563817.1 minor capsid protein [Staphylococcus pettenkoferi]